jgi:phospholipid/cholesterol/gamma-HCH transport system substrate-binding protein
MQGTQVQPATANMLTAESLAELVGGEDIALPPPGANAPGPPNAYDESNPPSPPWFPRPAQPGPGR